MEIYNYIYISLSLSQTLVTPVFQLLGLPWSWRLLIGFSSPCPWPWNYFGCSRRGRCRTAWPTPARRWRGWGCFATGRRLRPPGFRKTPHGHEEGDPHQTIVLLEMASGWKKTINDVSRSMDRLGHTVSTPRVGKNTETASALGN